MKRGVKAQIQKEQERFRKQAIYLIEGGGRGQELVYLNQFTLRGEKYLLFTPKPKGNA